MARRPRVGNREDILCLSADASVIGASRVDDRARYRVSRTDATVVVDP